MKNIFKILFILISSSLFGVEINYKELTIEAISVKNKVQYQYQDDKNWINVTNGEFLHKGATIKTGFNSKAIFLFGESQIYMGSLTKITVEQAIISASLDTEISLFVSKGKTFYIVNRAKKDSDVNFTVRSPIAVASVRGTKFYFYADGYVKCYEGTVVVSKSDRDYPNIYKNEEFGKSIPNSPDHSQKVSSGEYSQFNGNRPEPPKKFDSKPRENLDPPDNKLEEPPDNFRRFKSKPDFRNDDREIGPRHGPLEPPPDKGPDPSKPNRREPAIVPDDRGNKAPPPPGPKLNRK